jgi:hypothetical protein
MAYIVAPYIHRLTAARAEWQRQRGWKESLGTNENIGAQRREKKKKTLVSKSRLYSSVN